MASLSFPGGYSRKKISFLAYEVNRRNGGTVFNGIKFSLKALQRQGKERSKSNK
jgi:hypothetical protein